MAKYDLVCPGCGYEALDVQSPIGTIPTQTCPTCTPTHALRTTYKYRRGTSQKINFGFREARYSNETDSNIAKYQFEHL